MCKCFQIIVGVMLITFGFIFIGFSWRGYNEVILKHLPFSNRSKSLTFQLWINNSSSPNLKFSIYMFNWTNPHSSLGKKGNPNFQQIGPYVYSLETYKKNFVWNSNGTVTYTTGQSYNFVPELSVGDPYTDIITSPNVVLISIAPHLAAVSKFVKMGVNEVFKQYKIKLYVKKTVNELLFDGYDDELLDLLKPFHKYIPALKTLPKRFAWFWQKNNTMDDTFNVYTGEKNLSKMGLLHARNYTTRLPAFEGSCGMVNGSPGDFWPTDTSQREDALLFISEFCSTLQLQKQNSYFVHGFKAVKFEGDGATFDNGTLHPEQSCYCPNSECNWRAGVRDVSSCVGAPIFISFPHFYAADPSYLELVDGLEPHRQLHSFYMVFKEDYGVLLNGAARLQINIHLKPIRHLELLDNIFDTFLPTLWFEENIDLSPRVLDKLNFWLTFVPAILSGVGVSIMMIGSFIILLTFHKNNKKKRRRVIVLPSS